MEILISAPPLLPTQHHHRPPRWPSPPPRRKRRGRSRIKSLVRQTRPGPLSMIKAAVAAARKGGTMQWLVAAAAVLAILAAPADAKSVKIGVLGDQSSAYADLGGKGSVIPAA